MADRPHDDDEDDENSPEMELLTGNVVVYSVMLGATIAGQVLGILIDTALGWTTIAVPVALSVALESVAGARVGAAKLGGPLTPRHARRVSVTYSVGLLMVSVPLIGWIEASHPSSGGSSWTTGRFALALGVLAVATLARWGLMVLLAPRPRP